MDEIQQLRTRIDKIDDRLLAAICERVKVCRAIGSAKRKQGLTVRDSSREDEVYKRIKQKSVALGLDSSQIAAVYREIVNMCSAVQNKELLTETPNDALRDKRESP
jgi:chorismate mutase